jgi:hypothetical protein
MRRRTEIYEMDRQFADGDRDAGFRFLRPTGFDRPVRGEIPCYPYGNGDWHPGEPPATPPPRGRQRIQPGTANATDRVVAGIWEPWILSFSASIMFNGEPVEDVNDTMRASFVSYRVWDALREGGGDPDATFLANLNATAERQDLAGYRAGDSGRRTFYATNFGAGYPWPREHVPDSRCIDPRQGYWPLIVQWSKQPAPAVTGAFVIDWEWRFRQL